MGAINLTIVSGGQTGADRAALDWAIKNGITHGGWCLKGRKAEDGPIDNRYRLNETPKADYLQRTEWIVRDSDGTVIFTIAALLSGGSKATAEFATKHRKPFLHLSAAAREKAAARLKAFLREYPFTVLNVAGTRGSKEPTIGKFVHETLDQAFEKNKMFE
jgi:hypothetical protein